MSCCFSGESMVVLTERRRKSMKRDRRTVIKSSSFYKNRVVIHNEPLQMEYG